MSDWRAMTRPNIFQLRSTEPFIRWSRVSNRSQYSLTAARRASESRMISSPSRCSAAACADNFFTKTRLSEPSILSMKALISSRRRCSAVCCSSVFAVLGTSPRRSTARSNCTIAASNRSARAGASTGTVTATGAGMKSDGAGTGGLMTATGAADCMVVVLIMDSPCSTMRFAATARSATATNAMASRAAMPGRKPRWRTYACNAWRCARNPWRCARNPCRCANRAERLRKVRATRTCNSPTTLLLSPFARSICTGLRPVPL